jgi:pyruvate/2-oxoacid:ferredoxin oxidoreductase alpha subunit
LSHVNFVFYLFRNLFEMFRQSVKKVSPGQIAKATRLQGKRCNASTRSDNETTSKQSFSTSAAKPQPVEGQYNFDIMAKALEKAPTPEAYVRKVEPAATQPAVPMDGNQAAAYVAYAWSETSFIYPISPATAMGEHMDNWASQGRKNVLGQPVKVVVMQSEAGAAGACHGAVTGGVLTSSFTASQGLLLMIPNLYLMAGELMPVVLHVAARTVAKHALSIFNDHSDVMACRQTGFAQLCSNSVQEVMDLGLVAHVATIRARIPFMHFFDGFRTSHEVAKIRTIQYKDMERLMPYEELQTNLRNLALNPQHPIIRGTGQRPDIFFQQSMAAGRFFERAPDVVEAVMQEVAQLTGRKYNLFDYVGDPSAEQVVVMMGSGGETGEEVINFLNSKGDMKTGLVKVRLYRPWSAKRFLQSLPKNTKRITILDKTKEEGAQANPLYLDVACSIMDAGVTNVELYGGTYGLASKEFTPGQFKTIVDNMRAEQPKKRFVVGIDDDVTGMSLPVDDSFSSAPEGTKAF